MNNFWRKTRRSNQTVRNIRKTKSRVFPYLWTNLQNLLGFPDASSALPVQLTVTLCPRTGLGPLPGRTMSRVVFAPSTSRAMSNFLFPRGLLARFSTRKSLHSSQSQNFQSKVNALEKCVNYVARNIFRPTQISCSLVWCT